MEFIETDLFTRCIHRLLTDDDCALLQSFLSANPGIGKLIPGGKGLRKVRWKSLGSGQGKRGGVRVFYYCMNADRILMICAYPKSKQDDLTKEQLKGLIFFAKDEL